MIPKAADSLVEVVTEKHSTRHERSESRRKHLWADVSRWDPGMPLQPHARRQGLWNPSAGKFLETRAFKRCIYHRDHSRVFLPCTSPRAARSRSPSWQQPGNCTGFLSPVLANKQTKKTTNEIVRKEDENQTICDFTQCVSQPGWGWRCRALGKKKGFWPKGEVLKNKCELHWPVTRQGSNSHPLSSWVQNEQSPISGKLKNCFTQRSH